MGNFNLNFLGLPTQNVPNPELFEPYFLCYRHEDWSKGSGGGSLVYIGDDQSRHSMVVSEIENLGIALLHNSKEGARTNEFVSRFSDETIQEFVQVNDGIFMPKGAFYPPIDVWPAVRDFFENPREPSNKVRWIDSHELDWPEP